MRGNAITRIIIWFLVAVILTGILIVGLNTRLLEKLNIPVSFGTYENSESYSIGSGSVKASEINRMEINWIAGTISVEIDHDGKGDSIIFSEEAETDEAHQMHYLVKDGKLTIQFQKSGMIFSAKGTKKHLKVVIPENSAFEEFSVDCISASAEIGAIDAKEFEVESISGKISANAYSAFESELHSVSGSITVNTLGGRLECETVTGEIDIQGVVDDELEIDSTSGSITMALETCPEKVSIETVSGLVKLAIPEDSSFELKYESVSGDVSCEFPALSERRRITCDDGKCKLSFKSVSGDMIIEKLDKR